MGSLLWSTCAWFSALDKGAALLLLPYLGWTVFATVLINSLDTSPEVVRPAPAPLQTEVGCKGTIPCPRSKQARVFF